MTEVLRCIEDSDVYVRRGGGIVFDSDAGAAILLLNKVLEVYEGRLIVRGQPEAGFSKSAYLELIFLAWSLDPRHGVQTLLNCRHTDSIAARAVSDNFMEQLIAERARLVESL